MRRDAHNRLKERNSTGLERYGKAGHWWIFLALALMLTAGFSVSAYGAGGDIIWQKGDAQAGKQESRSSVVDSLGNVIITGYQNLAGGTNDDYYTVKLKADGSGVAWRASFDKAGGSDQATAVAVDSNNDVIVTGYVWNGMNKDIHTIKYNGATGAVLWQHTFNGTANGNDIGTTVSVDSLNNIYVGGSSQNAAGNDDYLIMKYSPNGPNPDNSPIWQVTYNGPANGIDQLTSLSAGTDGIAVTGESWNGTSFDMTTVKYDFSGTKLWERRYSSGAANICIGKQVKMDAAGNVIVTGSASNGIDLDIYTVKYNGATGAIIWSKTYNGAYDDEPNGLIIDATGDVYITGYTWTLSGTNDFYTARYNGDTGAIVWQQLFDSGNGNTDVAIATGIEVDPSGDVFVTGYTAAAGNYDFQTIKYKKDNGNQLWQQSFNGGANKNDRPVGIGVAPGGEVLVAGWSDNGTDLDYYGIKYDPGLLNPPTNLTVQAQTNTSILLSWADNSTNEDEFRIERCKNLGCTDFAEITRITSPPVPNSTGTMPYPDSGLDSNTYYSYRVRAYNATNGYSHYSNVAQTLTVVVTPVSPAWNYTYNGLAGSDDFANAIAVGPDNNPVVVGQSNDYAPGYSSGSLSFDYLTIKLKRTDSSVIWSDRYNDPTDALDAATCVAVDSNNIASVSGYATLFNGHGGDINSIYTIKYPAAGPPATSADQYNGPVATGATDDRAMAISSATDGSNNTVVIGHGKNAAGNDDIYVIKFKPDGSRAWAATPFDGGGDDFPTAVGFGTDGSVFVTGYSEKAPNSNTYNFFTAKYDGASGTRIWTDIYSVTAGGDNQGKSLAIDANGDIYVAGYAGNSAGNRDIYTIKYSGAGSTAQRVWERSVDGTVHGDDEAVSVKIDPVIDPYAGSIVVAGTTLTGPDDHDFAIIRYSQTGNTVWQTVLQRPANDDSAKALAMDYNGNIFVTGNTSNGLSTDSMTIKYDYLGNYIGATNFNGVSGSFDESGAIVVNSLDEAFVAGYATNAAGNADFLVYKIAANTSLPSVPYPFTATPLYTTVTVRWSDKSTVKSGYNLAKQVGACSPDNNNPWVDLLDQSATATSYTDSGLNIGATYCYRIRTYQSTGVKSRWNYLSTTTQSVPVPGNFTAIPYDTTHFNLSWSDTTTGETGFKIYRCTGGATTCPSNPSYFTYLGSAPANATTYPDITTCPSTSYTYMIQSYAASWMSSYAFSNQGDVVQVAPFTPAAPSGLTATRISEAEIDLSWTDNTTDETGYKVERCAGTGCSNFTLAGGALPANSTSFKDSGLVPDTTYTYRVKAYKSASCAWEVVSTSTASATTTLIAPINLAATGGTTTQINLSWNDNTASETGFEFKRCNGATCVTFTVGPNVTTYSDTTVCNSTTYTYQVRAIVSAAAAGYSGYSNTTLAVTTATPAAPSGFTATRISEKEIDLAWTDSTTDETAYRVERCTGTTETCTTDANFAQIGGDLPANTAVYKDTDPALAINTTYTYRVKAHKTAGCSWDATSSTASATTTLFPPSSPSATASLFGNCNDIRFIDSDGSTPLNYWIESGCASPATKMWLKIPSLAAGDKQIYLYYGNLSASPASSGDTVFNFFDDFTGTGIDSTKWTVTDGTGFSVANGFLHGTNTTGRLTSKTLFSSGIIQEIKARTTTIAPDGLMMGGFYTGTNKLIGWLNSPSDTFYMYNDYTSVSSTAKGGPATPPGNMLYRISAKTSSAVNLQLYNLDTSSLFWNVGDVNYPVSSDPIVLGTRYDLTALGETYAADWDWVRVRKYAAPEPTFSGNTVEFGSYSLAGGTWSTRRPLTITNSGSALTDYQVAVSVDTSSLGTDQVILSWANDTVSETGLVIERCTGASCTFASGATTYTTGPHVSQYIDSAVVPETTYCYHVKATKTGTGGWTSDPSPTVCATTSTWNPPGNLQATGYSSRVDLSWTDNSIGESAFIVERCSGASCDFSTSIPFNVAPGMTTFSDTTICPGEFKYRVKAYKAGASGWMTAPSQEVVATTITPPAPSGLTVTRISEKQLNLSWTSNTSGDETGFAIERCTTSACTYAEIDRIGTNVTTYADTDPALLANTGYTYRVKAFKTGDCAWDSDFAVASGITTALPPSNIVATSVSASQINLTWTDNTASESGLNLKRCEGTNCTTLQLPAKTASYSDVALKQATAYNYQLNAYNDKTVPPWTGNWSSPPVFAATKNLTLSAYSKMPTTIKLTWAATTGATSYRIETWGVVSQTCGWGCVNNYGWVAVTTVAAPTTTYTVTGLTANTSYQYRVVPINAAGSDMTPTDSVTISTTYSNLVVSSSGGTALDLSWSKVAAVIGYRLERKTGTGGTWGALTTVGGDATSYTDNAPAINTEYCYRLTAYDSNVDVQQSADDGVCGTTGGTPANLAATPINTTRIDLAWSDRTSTETMFSIDRCLGLSCDFSTRDSFTVGSNSTAYSDIAACNGTSYSYRIRAANYGLSQGNALWTRRVPLAIDTANFQPQFQTKVVVPYKAGMQANFNDIRFYDDTAKTELPYWIEKKSDGVSATVWLKTGANNNIYLYYGNSSATSASNGPATFEFFDDFTGTTLNTGKWTSGGSYISQNDALLVSGGAGSWGSAYLYSTASFPRPFIFEVDQYQTGGTSMMLGIKDTGYYTANTNFTYGANLLFNSGNRVAVSEDGTSRGDNLQAIAANAWQYFKFEVLTSGANYYYGASTDAYGSYYTSTYSTVTPLKIGFTNYDQAFKLDNARVRKYATPEPIVALGVEEFQPAGFTFGGTTYETSYSAAGSATTPAPAGPDALSATTVSELQINLAWTRKTTDESGFAIERCEGASCTNFMEIDRVAAGVVTYSDKKNLTVNTSYRYQVRAYKTAPCPWYSPYSPLATAITEPVAPGNPTATVVNTTQVSLGWTDKTVAETHSVVERCTGATCDFSTKDLFEVIANTTAYADVAACNATTYKYRIQPLNTGLSFGENGCWSRKVPLSITNFQPNFQTKLALSYASDMRPDFNDIRFFDATAGTELPYWIESKTDGVTATVWLKTGTNNNIYLYYGNGSASSASNGTSTFEFFDDFVGATIDTNKWSISNGTGFSVSNGYLHGTNTTGMLNSMAYFNTGVIQEVKAKTTSIATNGQIIGGFGTSSTNIGWLNSPGNAYYRSNNTYTAKGDQTPASTMLYTTAIKSATTANLQIYNMDSSTMYWNVGDIAISNSYVGNITLGNRYDALPGYGYYSYSYTGQAYATDWDWVRVRKYAATEPSASLGAETSSLPQACFTFGQEYAGTYSPATTPVTTPAAVAPSGFSTSVSLPAQVDLKWNDTNADETGFKLDRCQGANCSNFTQIGTLSANTISFSDTGLVPSTTYCYRVRVFKYATCGWELSSPVLCSKTVPATPTTLTATPLNSFVIRLTWSDLSSDEDGFEVETRVWNGQWVHIGVAGPNVTTFTDTKGIEPQKSYNYRLRAFRGGDKSNYIYLPQPVTTPAYKSGDTPCPG